MVMVIALLAASSLFVFHGMSSFLVRTLEESVDISAYFTDTASEEEILEIRQQLLSVAEVKQVDYISKEQALKRFVDARQGDQTVLESLDAIGTNPFLASLNIQADAPTHYTKIAEFLKSSSSASLIAQVDYRESAPVIERLSAITSGIRAGVLVISIVLACLALLVVFNTVRLTIYNSKEEIEIMRLVGASNWFIRGPFLIQGILVGILASVLSSLLLFGASYFAASRIESFTGFDMFHYVTAQISSILLLQFGVGIGLGIISSTIAIRKYLRI